MGIGAEFLAELDAELAATRRLLERVPDARGAWRPHARSAPLGHLAQLVARMPGVMAMIVRGKELDLAAGPGYTLESTETLLAEFDRHAAEAQDALRAADDGDFSRGWRLSYGEQVLDEAPRRDALRNTVNHFIHHRGQLTVYLRLNDVKLPQLYGPTADEP
jgi:uncharacterized damage-inducible protein DinB